MPWFGSKAKSQCFVIHTESLNENELKLKKGAICVFFALNFWSVIVFCALKFRIEFAR